MTADSIVESWKGQFHYKRESATEKGLRSPQIGALYAILAHIEDGEESGIVVMPTGTGKTETMLSFLVANQCRKVFVVVPTDALRSQTYRKFHSLGLLPKLGVVPEDIARPKVYLARENMDERDWIHIIDENNVIVTTMAIAARIPTSVRSYLRDNISYLFVDEVHHSKADTWDSFISIFQPQKVLMFTATPFRNDGQKLKGKIIFNFPLRKAQEQDYYEEINYYPIVEYSKEKWDKAIAKKAVEILKADMDAGYDHIVMARCKDKKRAEEVFKIYNEYSEFSPVVVYSGMPGAGKLLREIKLKQHRIIVCVNMLGEGYDLPQLKIAAIHDERQSLAVTLQFIGRFTRTNEIKLGKASFIVNIAYPPVAEEISCLYRQDADWNKILPRLNDDAADEQENLHEFLSSFHGELKDEISLESIRPALSAEIYTTESTTTRMHNWRKAIKNFNKYAYTLHAMNNDILVVVLGQKGKVIWGDMNTVENLTWDVILVYFDALNKRVYLNSSMDMRGSSFLENIFDGVKKIEDDRVYRVFANTNRLRLFNVGARLPQGKDISFQSFFGSSVQDGLDLLTQGKLQKNNIFGVGFKDGVKTSIGCSSKGKVWSRERANIMCFQKWCNEIGKIITDDSIDTNVVLENMLEFKTINVLPNVMPITIDWNPDVYEHCTQMLQIDGHLVYFDDITFNVICDPALLGKEIRYTLCYEDISVHISFSYDDKEQKFKHHVISNNELVFVNGNIEQSIVHFTAALPFSIYYADNSVQYGDKLCRPKSEPDVISDEDISTIDWTGVDLGVESMGREPYKTNSIQYVFMNTIIDEHDVLLDDDGSGELADLVGINDSYKSIDITLYHLKFAIGKKVSNDINNLYQVCGQAQKCAHWKYVRGDRVLGNLLKRHKMKLDRGVSGSILKGSESDLIRYKEEVFNKKELRFHIVIVQPGMSKSKASDSIRLLLGVTQQYLHQVANIDCRVICSE